MRAKSRLNRIHLFLLGMVLAAAFLSVFASCDGDADWLLRDGNKKVVAKVYPTGGKISAEAKDLAGGYIGLVSRIITDQSQVADYLTGAPTVLRFVGVESIECRFDLPVFDHVSKIIFDKDIRNVGAYAFEKIGSAKTLTEVEFEGENMATIGYHAFGPHRDQGNNWLIIVVPNGTYGTTDASHSAPNDGMAGNYWYWYPQDGSETQNMQVASTLHKIYVLPELGTTIDLDTIQMKYKTKTTRQELVIGTVPAYPYDGGGRAVEWAAVYYGDGDTHGGGQAVPETSVTVTSFTDAETGEVRYTHTLSIRSGESSDMIVAVTKWLPVSEFTTIRVIGNWPELAVNVTGTNFVFPNVPEKSEHHGEILVRVGTAKSYFEKTPTIPRDASGKQIAFWDMVMTSPDESGEIIFDGKTGEHWDLVARTQHTDEKGWWITTATHINLYAHWVNAATDNGVWYHYRDGDIDVPYAEGAEGWKADWANQNATDFSVTTPSQLADIARIDWRPGYRFVGWNRTPDCDPNTTEGWFDVAKEGQGLTTITDVYAIWTVNNLEVNLYGNEDVSSISPMLKSSVKSGWTEVTSPEHGQTKYTSTVNYNSSFDDIWFKPKRVGYKFLGWFTTAEGEETGYEVTRDMLLNGTNSLVSYRNGNPTVDLYAMWTPNVTTVTVKNDYPSAYTDSKAKNITLVIPYESTVCSFVSDITTPTGFSYFLAGAYLEDKTSASDVDYLLAGDPADPDPAKREPHTDNTQIFTRFFTLEDVVDGYTVVNSKIASAGSASTAGTNGVVWTYCGGVAEENNTLELRAFYAEGKSFRVRFYANWYSTDTNQVATQQVVRGQKAIVVTSDTDGTRDIYGTETTFTNYNARWWRGDGYHFFGWYTTRTTFSDYSSAQAESFRYKESTENNKFFADPVVFDVDLYAHWVPKRYKITIDVNKEKLGVIIPNSPPYGIRTIVSNAVQMQDQLNPFIETGVYDDYSRPFYTSITWYNVDSQIQIGGLLDDDLWGSVTAPYHHQTASIPDYKLTKENDYVPNKGWSVSGSVKKSIQERVDWSASSSWPIRSSKWTDGSSYAGDYTLYAFWYAFGGGSSYVASTNVKLMLSTNGGEVNLASSLPLWVTIDQLSGMGEIESDGKINSKSNNKNTYNTLANRVSTLKYTYTYSYNDPVKGRVEEIRTLNGDALEGFYSAEPGDILGNNLIKVLNADGTVYTGNLRRAEGESGYTNGFVFVDNNYKYYWVGGGCTLYAHWVK